MLGNLGEISRQHVKLDSGCKWQLLARRDASTSAQAAAAEAMPVERPGRPSDIEQEERRKGNPENKEVSRGFVTA